MATVAGANSLHILRELDVAAVCSCSDKQVLNYRRGAEFLPVTIDSVETTREFVDGWLPESDGNIMYLNVIVLGFCAGASGCSTVCGPTA